MIKTYRKTATIQAEQFDGSEEMIERYDIRVEEGLAMKAGKIANEIVYWLPVSTYTDEPFEMKVTLGDWIVLDGDEYEVMPNNMFEGKYAVVSE